MVLTDPDPTTGRKNRDGAWVDVDVCDVLGRCAKGFNCRRWWDGERQGGGSSWVRRVFSVVGADFGIVLRVGLGVKGEESIDGCIGQNNLLGVRDASIGLGN